MKWKIFLKVCLAWTSVGLLHALAQYSDIIKYDRQVDFSFNKVFVLVLSYLVWVIITLILLRFLKSFAFPFLFRQISSLFLISLVAWLLFYFAFDAGISMIIGGESGFDEWLSRLASLSGSVIFFYAVIYTLTFAACLGLVLTEKTKNAQAVNASLMLERSENALLLSEQKMQLMQLQLSPHFLFNCMGAISGLARQGKNATLVEAIATVGDLLRFTVNNSSSNLITLDEEISFVHHYISLQKLRFEDKFLCEFKISELDSDIMCPPFTVQLLLENVFRHGVEMTEEQVTITVSIQQDQNNVSIHVSNTHSKVLEENKNIGIGLENIRSRLRYLYADNFEFFVKPSAYAFDVHLSIPKSINVNEF